MTSWTPGVSTPESADGRCLFCERRVLSAAGRETPGSSMTLPSPQEPLSIPKFPLP